MSLPMRKLYLCHVTETITKTAMDDITALNVSANGKAPFMPFDLIYSEIGNG